MNGVSKLDRIKINKPLVLGDSYATLRNCVVEQEPGFVGEAAIIIESNRRIRGLTVENVYVECDPELDTHGVVATCISASNINNVRVFNAGRCGYVFDSVWNVDVLHPHAMYCGNHFWPACLVRSQWAATQDDFWRQATNDIRFTGGRLEGSKTQLRCEYTTDVVMVGTKLHGAPQRRDEAGPLCELVSPRGPHVFRGMTLAHGAEPQFAIEWGDKQAHISIDAVDSDWPLNRPRDLVGEVGNRPAGSDLEILKRVNTR